MREAGVSNAGRFVTVNRKVCPPHRGYSWSHHRSLHALDVDWNPIRKHKEAGARTVGVMGAPTRLIQRSGRNGGGEAPTGLL